MDEMTLWRFHGFFPEYERPLDREGCLRILRNELRDFLSWEQAVPYLLMQLTIENCPARPTEWSDAIREGAWVLGIDLEAMAREVLAA